MNPLHRHPRFAFIRPFWVLAPLLLAMVAACAEQRPPPPPSPEPAGMAPVKLAIDWNETHQTIVGFGGTMSWIHPPPEKRQEVFDLLFHKLGATVLRVQALGAENGDEGSLEPANDNDDPAVFNWDALPIKTTEAKNAVLIQTAQARGVKTIVPAAWSPPGWMKTNNSRVGGALKPDQLDEYAECWIAYVLGMKREFNIDLPYISPQNEPDLTYTYPTCAISADLYAQAAAKIAARLKAENLPTRVLGPDTCRIYHLEAYLEALHKEKVSPTLPALTHLYDLSIPFERVDKDRERWEAARAVAAQYKRPLWQMEYSNYLSHGVEKGSFAEALIWAQHIHWALTAGDCQVVCFWSLFFDKKGEALIYCGKTDDPIYEILPVFYTSLNYFRPVRPGMVRCTARAAEPTLLVSAFRTADKIERREIVVVINTGDHAQEVSWNVQGATPRVQDPGTQLPRWFAIVTSKTQSAVVEPVTMSGRFTVPVQAVVTLVRGNAETPDNPTLDQLCPPAPEP